MKSLSDYGENESIKLITSGLMTDITVAVGPGDDCAVVKHPDDSKHDLLLTSDPLIEEVHFEPNASPENIGHKAMGRVLSDIAAMGGTPSWVLMNISAPPSTDLGKVKNIIASANALASEYNCSIVGGDLARGEKIQINTFGVGIIPTGEAILRSGAKADDLIYVTGTLGGSRSGKHFSFTPRIQEGLFLRAWATSMIDISDGLATDLRHISESSNMGAFLHADQIPFSDTAQSLNQAMTDGEDFELLFTVPSAISEQFEVAWIESSIATPIKAIGKITDRESIIEIQSEDGSIRTLSEKGYQHF